MGLLPITVPMLADAPEAITPHGVGRRPTEVERPGEATLPASGEPRGLCRCAMLERSRRTR